MTPKQMEALQILAMGMARRAPFTKTDREHGIHAVNSGIAKELIQRGYAKPVTHWKGCVEITEFGRAQLPSSSLI